MNEFDIDPDEARLNDYLDGELSDTEARAFEALLAEHPDLRDTLAATRALLDEAKSLPADRFPERDLWAGVQQRLAGEAPKRGVVMPGPWAGLLLAAAAAIGLLAIPPMLLDRANPAGTTPGLTTVMPGPDADYREAKEALLAVIAQRRDDIPADTLATVEANLAIIENAVSEIRMALSDDPANPALERMLASAYLSELELLQRAVRTTP